MANIKSIVVASLLMTSACMAEPISIAINSAQVTRDERSGQTVLAIELTESSRKIFQKFSEDHLGRPAELRVDGQTLLRSVVREPITTGSLQITGRDWTDEKVRALANRLSQPGAKLEVEGSD